MGLTRAMVEHGPGSTRYREVLIPSADTHIVLSVWEADDTSAPVVVFVPGTMTHPLVYAESLNNLADRGTTVVGVHPVGHGNNPRTRGVIRLDDIVANARDAVDWAAEHFDGSLVISGSSQGGIMALLAAVDAHPRVTGCIAHNVLLPDLPESLSVTRLPHWLQAHYSLLRRAIRVLGDLVPGLPVPFGFYLDPKRVFTNPAEQREFLDDRRNLGSYPLRLLADLLTFDTRPITSGAIKVPVHVLASTGDPLFSYGYVKAVSARISAPRVEMVLLDLPMHLIFVAAPAQTVAALTEVLAKLR